jgi:hypothetical protein
MKKIALIVGERQDEALRMGVGLTLADDEVNVFVLDRKVAENDANDLNVETMGDMDVKLFTNCKDNANMEFISAADMAARLTGYDHIFHY